MSDRESSDSHLLWILRVCRSRRGLKYMLFGWESRRWASCGGYGRVCGVKFRCRRITVWGRACGWHDSWEFEHKERAQMARSEEPGT